MKILQISIFPIPHQHLKWFLNEKILKAQYVPDLLQDLKPVIHPMDVLEAESATFGLSFSVSISL